VNHQPEPIVAIRLQLGKMVATAQCGEFQCSLATPDGLQLRVTQRSVGEFSGRLVNSLPIPTSGRNGPGDLGQDLISHRWVGEAVGADIKWHSQYPTADVTAYRLRIDQV
jgi:hypothetical protein